MSCKIYIVTVNIFRHKVVISWYYSTGDCQLARCRYTDIHTFSLTHAHTHTQLKQTQLYLPNAEARLLEAIYILDYRFLLIPVVFTLLRMWTCIVIIISVYVQWQGEPLWLNILLVYLSVSESTTIKIYILQYHNIPYGYKLSR